MAILQTIAGFAPGISRPANINLPGISILNPGSDSHRHGAVCKREVRARKQGRRDEARAMLAEIYGWFTEGFGTADLKDAKALLNELNA
jgi:hypothetical protein